MVGFRLCLGVDAVFLSCDTGVDGYDGPEDDLAEGQLAELLRDAVAASGLRVPRPRLVETDTSVLELLESRDAVPGRG